MDTLLTHEATERICDDPEAGRSRDMIMTTHGEYSIVNPLSYYTYS